MKNTTEFMDWMQSTGREDSWRVLAETFLSQYLEESEQHDDLFTYTRDYADKYIAGKSDAAKRLTILYWYHSINGDKEISAYLITLFGTIGVIESQRERLIDLFDAQTATRVFTGIDFPPLGTSLSAYPIVVKKYLAQLRENLTESQCQSVLAGNHHGLDPERFQSEKEFFLKANNINEYLEAKHKRLIANLQDHCDTGKMWFEQHITQAVVDYIAQHQEIQTGVVHGNEVIVQKIPYAPDKWLEETDLDKKRFLACHCPFVRASIQESQSISSIWCYCTGGFTKVLFDYLYEQSLQVRLLESVLDGSQACRFAITLPNV